MILSEEPSHFIIFREYPSTMVYLIQIGFHQLENHPLCTDWHALKEPYRIGSFF